MKYCFDTSGITNPLQTMPEDIYVSMWNRIQDFIHSKQIVVTTEIYKEMELIDGDLGECIKENKKLMLLEVGDNSWDWNDYVRNTTAIIQSHRDYISEYTGGSPKTICLTDISIIALAKSLNYPVVSMEAFLPINANKKRRIPNVCKIESVEHLSFNDFLRKEGIRF